MQFYLFNIQPKLHHRKLRILCILTLYQANSPTLTSAIFTARQHSWLCRAQY